MTYIVHCRELGFDCEGIVRAETEEEVMKQVAEHAGGVHDVTEITDELVAQVRAVMIVEE